MMLPVTEVPQQYPGPVEYHLDKQVEMGGHIHATELYLVLPGSSAVQPLWSDLFHFLVPYYQFYFLDYFCTIVRIPEGVQLVYIYGGIFYFLT